MKTPTLALFGGLDNNIVAAKNRAAWQAALEAGGHRDFTLQVLPQANHILLEAARGNNAEMASLQRVVPAYFSDRPRVARQAAAGACAAEIAARRYLRTPIVTQYREDRDRPLEADTWQDPTRVSGGIVGALQGRDVDLLHLQHRLHHAFRLRRIGVTEHLAERAGIDLP